jgi:uncharacterized protein (DUF1501 family)
MDYARTIDRTATLMAAASDTTQQAVDVSAALSIDPTLTTVFPGTDLGAQLQQVAKVMKLNLSSSNLSLNRQIFYVETGGYDTHQDQLQDQADRLTELSQAIGAFYQATLELGISDRVVTFTLSDFGRTLEPSGDQGSVGSDHGWGSHQFVIGNAVAGGNFYGVPNPSTGQIFPQLVMGGPDDISNDDRGRWIPTTSVEQYAGTLARWFGVSALDLPVVLPLVANFSPTTLGFLTPGTSC